MALLPWDENRNLWEETEKEAPVLVLKGMQASELQGENQVPTTSLQPECMRNWFWSGRLQRKGKEARLVSLHWAQQRRAEEDTAVLCDLYFQCPFIY